MKYYLGIVVIASIVSTMSNAEPNSSFLITSSGKGLGCVKALVHEWGCTYNIFGNECSAEHPKFNNFECTWQSSTVDQSCMTELFQDEKVDNCLRSYSDYPQDNFCKVKSYICLPK